MTDAVTPTDFTPEAKMVPAVDPQLVAAVLAALPAIGITPGNAVATVAPAPPPAVPTGPVLIGTVVGQQNDAIEDWSQNRLMREIVSRVPWHTEANRAAAMRAADKYFADGE